jgi:hypothetical protein
VDNILRWSSLKPGTKRKLLWDNATRFYCEDVRIESRRPASDLCLFSCTLRRQTLDDTEWEVPHATSAL